MSESADSFLAAYRRLRRRGELEGDPDQELAAEKLQALELRLKAYRPHWQAGRDNGWRQRLSFGRRREPPPQGLYIYGAVGRGKSMLMDLFFRHAPPARKRRVHFHAFMQEVHGAIHQWRQLDPARRGGDDPIAPLARRIAEGAWLFCFDEFQVGDVADAMILGRLFEQLFAEGVVVVATSNRPPDELYAGGLNRPLFLPFIALIKERLDVLHLAGTTDYRLRRIAGRPVWHSPLGAEADRALDEAFALLADGAAGTPLEIAVQGRCLKVPRQARGVARMSFHEACAAALGPADYLALARHFHSLVLDRIPLLGPEQRNEARRFVTLIDALYEARAKLIASAAGPPEALYPQGDGAFEFRRTASRLHEMQGADYLAAPHRAEG
jgi:cell division protein ZapE